MSEDKPRIFLHNTGEVASKLEEGYVFDPWLCSKGYPIMAGEQPYWVMVRPEVLIDPVNAILLTPFIKLPEEAAIEAPAGYGTVFVAHGVSQDEYIKQGYVLLHKDHADAVGPDKAKGTVLTLTKKPVAEAATPPPQEGEKI